MLKRRNKFNATRCEYDGHKFASLGERDCYIMLKFLERAGELTVLAVQDKVWLTEIDSYRVDFKVYSKREQRPVWIEFKGAETPSWRKTFKRWQLCGPGKLEVYKRVGKRIVKVAEADPVKKDLHGQLTQTGLSK